jgi:hypothetical protein
MRNDQIRQLVNLAFGHSAPRIAMIEDIMSESPRNVRLARKSATIVTISSGFDNLEWFTDNRLDEPSKHYGLFFSRRFWLSLLVEGKYRGQSFSVQAQSLAPLQAEITFFHGAKTESERANGADFDYATSVVEEVRRAMVSSANRPPSYFEFDREYQLALQKLIKVLPTEPSQRAPDAQDVLMEVTMSHLSEISESLEIFK